MLGITRTTRAMPMQERSHNQWQRPARAVPAALAAVLTCALSTAPAQQKIQPQAPAQSAPGDLFGSLPEPPTEHTPAAPVLDGANPDYTRLQRPEEAFSALPADPRGRPDWMRALREGAIEPRSGVGGGQTMQLLESEIVMKNTAQMPFVSFPHRSHTQWLACSNCHDAIFAPRAGANAIDMTKILRGESCGVCHSTVAFTAMFTCERCHSVPQPGQKRWW